MESYAERKAMVHQMLGDPDLNLTTKESLTYIYNWMGLEYALLRRAKTNRKIRKYATRLENDRQVFVLRTTLTDL